jgi:hypothetical protein
MCAPEVLLAYTLGRWPLCCDAVMTYTNAVVAVPINSLSDTRPEVPALAADTEMDTLALTSDPQPVAEQGSG